MIRLTRYKKKKLKKFKISGNECCDFATIAILNYSRGAFY